MEFHSDKNTIQYPKLHINATEKVHESFHFS